MHFSFQVVWRRPCRRWQDLLRAVDTSTGLRRRMYSSNVANVVDDFEVLVIDCGSASVFFLETSEGTGCTAASLSEHKWSLRKFQAV